MPDTSNTAELLDSLDRYDDLADHLHSLVEATITEGLCPRCMADLDDDGFCVMCGATFAGPVEDATR